MINISKEILIWFKWKLNKINFSQEDFITCYKNHNNYREICEFANIDDIYKQLLKEQNEIN